MTEATNPGRRLELVATLLLAAATVATAWSGYQASRWNGEQAKAFSRAGGLRVESAKADSLANTQTELDVTTFTRSFAARDALRRDARRGGAAYALMTAAAVRDVVGAPSLAHRSRHGR